MKSTIIAAALALASSASARAIRRQEAQAPTYSYNVSSTVLIESNGEWIPSTTTQFVQSSDGVYSRNFGPDQNLTNIELQANSGIKCVTYISWEWQPLVTIPGTSTGFSQDFPASPPPVGHTAHFECAPSPTLRPAYRVSTFTYSTGQLYQYPDVNGRIYRAIGEDDSAMMLQYEEGDVNAFRCYAVDAEGVPDSDTTRVLGAGNEGPVKFEQADKLFAGGSFVCEPVPQ